MTRHYAFTSAGLELLLNVNLAELTLCHECAYIIRKMSYSDTAVAVMAVQSLQPRTGAHALRASRANGGSGRMSDIDEVLTAQTKITFF